MALGTTERYMVQGSFLALGGGSILKRIHIYIYRSADASRACRWQSANWSSFGISYQGRRLLGLLFFSACCARCPKPCIFPVFLGLSCSQSAFRLGLWVGGGSPDAQDLHPRHHQDYLDAMNLSFFADASGVLLFRDEGIGLFGVGVGPSAAIL